MVQPAVAVSDTPIINSGAADLDLTPSDPAVQAFADTWAKATAANAGEGPGASTATPVLHFGTSDAEAAPSAAPSTLTFELAPVVLAQTANPAATPSAAPSVNPQVPTAPNAPAGGLGMGPMLGLGAALQGIINAWDADPSAVEQKMDTLLANINEMESSGDPVQWALAQSLRVELLGETLHRDTAVLLNDIQGLLGNPAQGGSNELNNGLGNSLSDALGSVGANIVTMGEPATPQEAKELNDAVDELFRAAERVHDANLSGDQGQRAAAYDDAEAASQRVREVADKGD